MQSVAYSTSSTFVLHNGPVCATCGVCYIGTHTCSTEDILRRVNYLLGILKFAQPAPTDRMAGCPCRPENGGSGVCGCTLSGPQITCLKEK